MSERVLIVDDDVAMCQMTTTQLSRRGYAATSCTSGQAALEMLESSEVDVVVTDLNMRGLTGIELCTRLASSRPELPVIVITAFGSLETAIAAIRAGAYDFITKPFDIEQLVLTLERAASHRRLKSEVQRLRLAVESSRRFDEIIGTSPPMKRVFELIERAAAADVTVLITGESGTGKELVAKALHRRSRRAEGPFLAINCAAMPEALLESEFFGHAKGAFTDARAAHEGLFVQAHGGTLLLDEIGDMPLGLQPKILRALQERSVRPIGGSGETSFDVRVVASTNRDLLTAVEEKRFREDLYYRLDVVHIEVPPLRARGSDVLLLAQHFVQSNAAANNRPVVGVSTGAAEKLLAYSWPGNVRELSNCMERAVALTSYDKITVEDLPERIRSYRSSHVIVASDDPSELVPLEEVERRYIERVLEAVAGNKREAARILGVDRKTLYRKLERWGARSDPASRDSQPPTCG